MKKLFTVMFLLPILSDAQLEVQKGIASPKPREVRIESFIIREIIGRDTTYINTYPNSAPLSGKSSSSFSLVGSRRQIEFLALLKNTLDKNDNSEIFNIKTAGTATLKIAWSMLKLIPVVDDNSDDLCVVVWNKKNVTQLYEQALKTFNL